MELPPANFLDSRLKDCDELNDLFEGDCEFKQGLALTDEPEQQEVREEEGEGEVVKAEAVRPLQELERLATTVRSILFDCYVVPKGV